MNDADELDRPERETIKAGAAGALVGPLDDYSGVTADANSHEVVPANDARVYLMIQNVDDADTLWIDFGTDAVMDQPSIQLPPGAALEFGIGKFMPNQSVNLIAPADTHYTIKSGG